MNLSGLVGCSGLLVHSLFDFNLHIPANALLFFVAAHLATARIQPDSAGVRRDASSPPAISKTVGSLCETDCIMSRGQVAPWLKLDLGAGNTCCRGWC